MYYKDYIIRTGKNILIRFPKRVVRFFEFWSEYGKFNRLSENRQKAKLSDVYPCLNDKISFTPFDQHYIYHPAWAARILAQTKPESHTDISSILSFSTIVSAFVPIKFYDYRPAHLNLPGLQSEFADLKKLPFQNDSIPSLSCMHTIEHIGLGRYGDELDPNGDVKAISELKRVVQPGGDLLFVVPIGTPRVEFNGHRIYSFDQIVEFFKPFQLKEFTLIPDKGGIVFNADPDLANKQIFACGCFWFKK